MLAALLLAAAMPVAQAERDRTITVGERIAGGMSGDHTLPWEVQAITGADPGARLLRVRWWGGAGWRLALLGVSGVPVR